nr:F-box/kelch-repeat protein At3g23880-like [Ipomoea batatas]
MQFPYNLNSANGNVEFRNTFYWWASDIKDLNSARGGVEFCNTFYWWASDIKDYLSRRDRNKILDFDPVRDEFRILPTHSRTETKFLHSRVGGYR